MIHDLDKTLETLIKQQLPPALAGQVTISFATPDDQFPPTGVSPLPLISFFMMSGRTGSCEITSGLWTVRVMGR